MALTRLPLGTALSGTVPAANINSTSLGNVDVGKVIKVSYANPSNYETTIAYNSTSLTPAAQITVTATRANSNFLITWSAIHGRFGNGRSQYLLSDTYTAGENNYSEGNWLFFDHYALYHANATNFRQMTSYSYYDTSQSLAVGASVTYYVFLGLIGSGTSDQARNQRLQVMEIAQ